MKKHTHATLVALATLASAAANAQWTATILHPNGYDDSFASLGVGDDAYGSASQNGVSMAGRFSQGGFTSWNPNGATSSGIAAIDGGHEYGTVVFGNEHAGRWSGSAASFEDWNPTGSQWSDIYTAKDGVAGGYATFGGTERATLWNGGGKDDTTDLHNDAWLNSSVDAISGGVQYGDYENAQGFWHAGKWNGTVASFIDLNPANYLNSQIIGANGGMQAGWANDGSGYHAMLWSGTAASAIDINPLGSTESVAYDLSGNNVAGYAVLNGTSHAAYWDSAANQFVDLSSFMDGIGDSTAYGIQVTANDVRVYGAAWSNANERYEAVMWSNPVPEPASILALGLGLAGIVARRRTRRG